MRAAAFIAAVALGVAGIVPVASPAQAAVTVDQVSSLGPSGGGQSAWFGDSQTVAQAFTVGVSGSLTKVTVSIGTMRRTTDTPPNTGFTVAIYAANAAGEPTGSALRSVPFGSADVAALGFDRTPTTVTATLPTPLAVSCGQRYAIVLSTPDSYPAYHWFIGTSAGFTYSVYGNWPGNPWNRYDPYPLVFSTFVDAAPSFTGSPPGAPGNPTATAGDTTASVAFEPPASCGSSVSDVQYEIDGSGTWVSMSPARTGSPVDVTGLANGRQVSIRLRAVNASGIGTPSAPVLVTPQRTPTAPSAPTAVSAVTSDGEATLRFTAPSDDGGSPIVNYEYQIDGSGSWVPFQPTVTTSPVTIANLVNGTPVSIELRAVNAVGAGAASSPITVTPSAQSGPAPSGGGGAGDTASVGAGAEPGNATRPDPVAAALAPVAVNGPVPVGEGLVIVDGRSSKVSVQVVGNRTWRVTGEGFSMEFVPQALRGELEGTFSARAGSWVDITGDGYQPDTLVATYLPGILAASLGEERVGQDGTFTVRARFPLSITPGQYILQVNGLASRTSVRSVNLGLMLIEAEPTKRAIGTRIMFKPASVVLTPAARRTISRLVSEHRSTATSAVVVPTIVPGATTWARGLAVRRAQAVVAAMKASGFTVPARPSKRIRVAGDAGAAQRTTAWIRVIASPAP